MVSLETFMDFFSRGRSRVRPRFFDQVGHETMYASSKNKHFSLNHVIVRHPKIMNNLLKHLKICTFKVIFLSPFRKKKFYEEY